MGTAQRHGPVVQYLLGAFDDISRHPRVDFLGEFHEPERVAKPSFHVVRKVVRVNGNTVSPNARAWVKSLKTKGF